MSSARRTSAAMRDRRAARRHNPVARLFRALAVAVVAERDAGAEVGERDGRRGADAG